MATSTQKMDKDLTQEKETTVSSSVFQRWEGVADKRPSDLVCAFMSNHVYEGKKIKVSDTLPEDPDWEIVSVRSSLSGYFGAIYYNDQDKHYVVAHRGTDNAAGWLEDFKGIYLGLLSPQKEEAYQLTKEAVDLAKKAKNSRISFTGHSLGAFLAELSVFYCYKSFDFLKVNAVTFESPGSRDSLKTLQSQFEDQVLDLNQLDIVGYVSYPNLINTCNHRVGTCYQLDPKLGDFGWIAGWYEKKSHDMDELVKIFEGKGRPPRAQHLVDWPLGNQKDVYFKHAKFEGQKYEIPPEAKEGENFKLQYGAHYKIDEALSKPNVIAARHFNRELQEFLLVFHKWREDIQQLQGETQLKKSLEGITDEHIKGYLLNYTVGLRSVAEVSNTSVVRLKEETADITKFRQDVSNWLNRAPNRKIIMDLLNKPVAVNKKSSLEVFAAIVAPGATVRGSVQGGQAIAGQFNVPVDQGVGAIIDVLDKLQKDGGYFQSYVVAPGGIVGEDVIGASAIAGQFNLGSNNSGGGASILTDYQRKSGNNNNNASASSSSTLTTTNSNMMGNTSGGK